MKSQLLTIVDQLEEIKSDLQKSHNPIGAKLNHVIEATKQVITQISSSPTPKTRRKIVDTKDLKIGRINKQLNEVWADIRNRKNNEQAIA